MTLLLEILATFALGAVNIVLAVPAGVLAGLHYAFSIGVAAAGSMTSVLVVVFVGGWVREKFLAGAKGPRMKVVMRWVTEATDRYGMIGFGLLAPLLLGIPVAAALAAASGMKRRTIVLMMACWVAFWAVIFGLIFGLNLGGLYRFLHRV